MTLSDHERGLRADDAVGLAEFLGGSADSYTRQLVDLIGKADQPNRRLLAEGYPRAVAAYTMWERIAPCSWGELHDALERPPYPGPGRPCPHDGGRYAPGFRCASCARQDRLVVVPRPPGRAGIEE